MNFEEKIAKLMAESEELMNASNKERTWDSMKASRLNVIICEQRITNELLMEQIRLLKLVHSVD